MDRDFELRLARIEGKINIIARWLVVLVSLGVAFSAYYLFRSEAWGPYVGIGVGFLAGFAFERAIAGLEKRLSYDEDGNS